jgi:hypothetical protein
MKKYSTLEIALTCILIIIILVFTATFSTHKKRQKFVDFENHSRIKQNNSKAEILAFERIILTTIF